MNCIMAVDHFTSSSITIILLAFTFLSFISAFSAMGELRSDGVRAVN